MKAKKTTLRSRTKAKKYLNEKMASMNKYKFDLERQDGANPPAEPAADATAAADKPAADATAAATADKPAATDPPADATAADATATADKPAADSKDS